ncbi:erythromycin esterase family protein [Nocardia sp. NPDC051570]|uniref:erythromycin esterase family protein n=1 Tax=Nocardia sp. NPDC051570 TaxID=3364324 RepID=UPI0037AAADDC
MATNTQTARLSDAALLPLHALDPDAPLDDLHWLDDAIGDARVVAIGESAHYTRESYRLRHRLLRYLVERHGFGAYAMESGFVEGPVVDAWIRGGKDQLGHVLANGITSLMGLWTEMGAQLEWMREHNRTTAQPVGWYGIDLGGSNVSPRSGLHAVIAYLAQADPEFEVDPIIQETATSAPSPSPFAFPAIVAAYGELASEQRDALTAGLADLTMRVTGRRLEYVRRTTVDAYERALRVLHLTVSIDAAARAMARGDQEAIMFTRDAAQADTVEWILRREDRILLAAHNGHVQRWPTALPGRSPMTPLGMHLADRLGADYLTIGMTMETGQALNAGADFYNGTLFADLETPQSGSLDALMAASHAEPFATDLRRLSSADTATMRTVTCQRIGNYYTDLNPLEAYDVVVHLPCVTAATPAPDALADSPEDVQQAFSQWMKR